MVLSHYLGTNIAALLTKMNAANSSVDDLRSNLVTAPLLARYTFPGDELCNISSSLYT